MATLKEILRELEVLIEEVTHYIEVTDSDNLASDLEKDVLDDMETAAANLEGIIGDKVDGLYDEDEESDFLEEDDY
jgi:hypothetical protein